MASGTLQVPSQISDFGSFRNGNKALTIPSGSRHIVYTFGSSESYCGMYMVNCTSQGAVAVYPVKAFSSSYLSFTTGSNNLTLANTNTSGYVTLLVWTLQGDKAHL